MAGRTEQVIEAIRQRLAARSLAPGEKLPSVRRLAAAMAVSPSTVVEAYDRLVTEGAVRSRRGSGFYVSGHRSPLPLAEVAPRQTRPGAFMSIS